MEKDIQELKKRIGFLEKQVQNKQLQSSNILRLSLTFIIVLVTLLILIGIFQFITPQPIQLTGTIVKQKGCRWNT
ncbi:hypothetical protein J2Z66_005985 [Paenibacillus eucommiae]|uniref:Uncharacterized protein n=1 Tax=Paenibacillus eucommiae TaxID=1355755 RepID=A0ABS4J6C4_9BACL|nr:hypothetical protein [Paenibacillus eucommiae]